VSVELTSSEQRGEAARLLSLDEHGLEVESVAMALRLFEQQERAMAKQVEIDRESTTQLRDIGSRNLSPEERLESLDV
tara:strand:+ start:52462 stop:52695 length:234 start_codon:yes stop_codon:yes gene_type:complete